MKKYSKLLSYVLRHKPAELDLELDRAGWVEVDVLLTALQNRDSNWSEELLAEVVATNDKKRFEIVDGKIRARQGHSIDVDLGYSASDPPEVLFHGTIRAALDSIRENGLSKMKRHHVHLSADIETAKNVGGRRGKPVVLRLDAAGMAEDGLDFFVTPNGVWLVDSVPVEYIEFPED